MIMQRQIEEDLTNMLVHYSPDPPVLSSFLPFVTSSIFVGALYVAS